MSNSAIGDGNAMDSAYLACGALIGLSALAAIGIGGAFITVPSLGIAKLCTWVKPEQNKSESNYLRNCALAGGIFFTTIGGIAAVGTTLGIGAIAGTITALHVCSATGPHVALLAGLISGIVTSGILGLSGGSVVRHLINE